VRGDGDDGLQSKVAAEFEHLQDFARLAARREHDDAIVRANQAEISRLLASHSGWPSPEALAQLPHHHPGIRDAPVLDDPAPLEANDVGKRHGHLLAARRKAYELPFVGALHRRANEDLVALRD
jgi:hypothetical protein